jgi:hemoglobin
MAIVGPEHLEKMSFWLEPILEVHATYSGSPFSRHKQLPVDKEHFDRWMEFALQTNGRHIYWCNS